MAGFERLPPSVRSAVRSFLKSDASRTAVFDADGTLWRGDIGEDFLRYLAANKVVSAGAYSNYDSLLEHDPLDAYAFAVRVMAGLREVELESLCATFFAERYLGRVFPFVRPLFEMMRCEGVALWVCSASPRWIVEAGARALGVEPEHVIGVDADVHSGVLTDTLRLPVTAGPGKVQWLSRRGVTPGFAAGNGELDIDMLKVASHRLVVAPPDGFENALVRHARTFGWTILKT
jgi:phosphoserine phosphatase